ncbi:MAG: glycosyltransferase family 39 protein [Anaerolineaceae bacterium]
MVFTKKRVTLIFIFIILLAILLRCGAMVNRSFWYDEAFSILISEKGPQAILAGTLTMDEPSVTADIHPPTYYFLLDGWIQLFGTSVVAARILSLLLGVGILINIFLLTKELLGVQSALLASFGVAVFPFQVQFATEIRMYALLTFFLTLATYAFIKGMRTRSWLWWGLFALTAALAQYTQNLAAFYLVPLALTSLFKWDGKLLKQTVFAVLGAVLLYIPWLIHLPAQFAKIQHHYWIERPTLAVLINLLLRYTTNLPLPDQWMLPALLIAFLSIALAVLQTLRMFRLKTQGYKIGLWLAWLSFAPPLFLWLFSQWTPVYVDRALLASQAIFCTWLAWVLLNTSMPKVIQWTMTVILVVGVGLGLSQLATNNGYGYDPLKKVEAIISSGMEPGDMVVHSNKLTYLPFFYYDPNLPMTFIGDDPGGATDTLSQATRKILGVNDSPDIESSVSGAQRIWFVIYEESVAEYVAAGYVTHAHLRYLDEHYTLNSYTSYGNVLLFQYERKPL